MSSSPGLYTATATSSTIGSKGRNITRVRDRNFLVDDPNTPEYDNGPGEELGAAELFVAGIMQTMGLIPISTLLLRTSDERYRGRIMGIRMMAIYGNLPGLLLAGPFIAHFGSSAMATTYSLFGLSVTVLITWFWRAQLGQSGSAANRR